MIPYQHPIPFCQWPLCLSRAENGTHCDAHVLIAGQHESSHEMEGHVFPIRGCRVCNDPDGWLRQRAREALARRDEQCSKRGPGLTHMQDGRVRPNGECVYCGEPTRA